MAIGERQGEGAVTGDDQSATVRFWISGQSTWAGAYNELYNASVGYTSGTPNYSGFNGIPAQSVHVDEVSERLGYWNGSVNYGYDTPRNITPTGTTPSLEFSFDTSVRPRLERWRSDGDGWSTIGSIVTASGEGAVDHDGLGWGGLEKGYEGIQVPRPETSFNLQYTPISLTTTDLKQISDSVGTVNLNAFYGFASGEVLFAGAQGQAKTNDRWRLSYQFLVKKNRTNVDCGNGITIATVDGWNIIEVEYKRTKITIPTPPPSREKFIERARQARVLQPYDRLDFSAALFP